LAVGFWLSDFGFDGRLIYTTELARAANAPLSISGCGFRIADLRKLD
jgi:hypothetical protein